NSTENPDGVYSTETKSLGSFANGKYYLEVEVTKGSSTMKEKVWFEIRSLRVDLVPMGEMEHIMSFLKGQDVRLGLFIINMQTGDQLAGDEIYGADVVGCRDEKGKDCLTKLTGNLNQTEAGFMEFSKILRFTAPNEIGEFFISVEVDTSAGLGRGETSIFVQNVIAYTETKDQFGMWRWRYGAGENVSLDVKAFTGNYTPASVTRVEILEIRNESWGDITSQVIPNTSNRVANGNQISFSAPQGSGWYNVKLKVNTTSGEGYVGAGFNVRLYDIWVDLMDGPYANNSWKWRFGGQNDVYFHINVYNLGGYEEDNMIDSSNYRLSFVKLRNEMTHREYANLNVTKYQEISDDDWGRPVFRLSLANLGLESGFYMAEFELTDLGGNKDSGEAWFKISNLDIWISTQTETGESKWRFEPTSNITFSATAKYFNGTDVPDGSNISIEGVMYAQKGPPMPIPSDVYNKSGTVQTSSGNAKTWIKANPGKSLAQGHYMTLIKVVIPDGTQEIQEAWFEVSVVDVYGWSEPWIVSQSQNVTMKITAKKMDGSPVNATLTLVELRDTMTWTEVDRSLYDYGLSKNATGAQATTNFNFSVANLPTGQYEAVIRVNAYDLGATHDAYVWFSVQNYQISGELADPSKRVYAPEENVEMWITVRDPNGAGLSNENVTIYQFANTESWPWSFTSATMIGQPSPTDSNGRTKVTFKAPKDAGMYRPMANISGELKKDPWQLPDFGVRSAAVNVKLMDESGNERDDFAAEAKVQVEINISNPTGGEISVSQIRLKHKKLDTNQETDLQTITTGIDENNYVNFTAPDSQGEYVLFVSVTDSTTGNIIIAKRWFRVRTFDLKIWTEKWAHDSGQNVTINIDARNPDGSQANITVRLQDLNDMWTWATPSGYNVVANPTNISGAGEYNVSTQNLSLGEYDVVLCIYSQGGPPGSQCEYGQRFYMGFSIQSFDVHAYIDKGSFTTQDTIELFLEVKLSNGTFVNSDSYTANFIDLRDLRTWSNVSSNLTSSISIENQTSPKRKKINFTANLAPGEYMASFNVTYQGESRIREIWFKMSDYEMTLDSIPSCTQDCKFFANEVITFNVSLSPTPSENISGKLILMDDYRWIKISEESITIGTNGFVLHNLTISDSGRYTLRAEVGTAERFFWFEVGAYDIEIKYWLSEHDIPPDGEIQVYFDIKHPNGTDYTGNVSVIVKEIMNAWDWTPTVVQNLNETNVSAQASQDELFNFTPYLGSGEYEAILRFKAKGKNTIEHYHFNVRTKEFWTWPEGGPFMPGENVTIKAVLRYPNGTAWQGVNISIEEIYYQKEDKSVMNDVNFITKYADTGSDGMVTLKFVSLPNETGKFDVRLMERKDNETTWMGFDVNTYELRIDRTDDKWVYLPDEY
ncbi:MAG: Ig-like domain-containing protein, partial [Candidatus Aenigmarchaeota archaeon]|nr:Ig-like domain-containing protein [Candidatus Aenigmarchaeota archaeon]